MKVQTYYTESESDALTGNLLRNLERLVCKHKYLVPDGWRLILEMQAEGDANPYYHLDVQSNRGGGSYAKAKMTTLENFPKHAATGGDSLPGLLEAIRFWEDDRIHGKIASLESIDLLTEEMWLWLRDLVGYVPCYGGIRIPYEDIVVEDDDILNETGEIRVAFSGASEEQDLFFALNILKTLQGSFVEFYPNVSGWFNLRELSKIPVIKLWLDLLDIKEA